MKPWKIAAILIVLIVIALAIAPLVEKPANAPEPMSIPKPTQQASSPVESKSTTQPNRDANPVIRAEANQLPANTDPAVVEQLSAIKNAQSPDDKFIAMVELAENHPSDPAATLFFIESINASDADTRLIAVECLRNMNNPASIPQLQASLASITDGETREFVQELIDYLQTTESYAEATGDIPVSKLSK